MWNYEGTHLMNDNSERVNVGGKVMLKFIEYLGRSPPKRHIGGVDAVVGSVTFHIAGCS